MIRALALFFLVSNVLAQANPNCDNLRGRPINTNVDWQTQIKPIFNEAFGGQCSGCHGFGGSPDFTDQGQDAIYKLLPVYVLAGSPFESWLFVKINCANPGRGARMPLNRPALTLDQQGLIYDWIRQGAYGENPAQPIGRNFIRADGFEGLR